MWNYCDLLWFFIYRLFSWWYFLEFLILFWYWFCWRNTFLLFFNRIRRFLTIIINKIFTIIYHILLRKIYLRMRWYLKIIRMIFFNTTCFPCIYWWKVIFWWWCWYSSLVNKVIDIVLVTLCWCIDIIILVVMKWSLWEYINIIWTYFNFWINLIVILMVYFCWS